MKHRISTNEYNEALVTQLLPADIKYDMEHPWVSGPYACSFVTKDGEFIAFLKMKYGDLISLTNMIYEIDVLRQRRDNV